MNKCANCRYFVVTDTEYSMGQCYAEPPRKTSQRGNSFRPTVSHTDPACVRHALVLRQAPQLEEKGPRRFCYAGQSATLRDNLRECGITTREIIPITDAAQLGGVMGGVFFVVDGHRASIPDEIADKIIHAGMIIVKISDAFLRQKLARVAA